MADWWSGDYTSPVVTLKNGYNTLDERLTWTPSADGDAHFILYAKLRLRLWDGLAAGKIRRRADRAKTKTQTVDATAYEDIAVVNDSGEEFDWLINATWDGQVWKGRSMKWLLNIGPEFASAKLLTRYAKVHYWPSR